MTTEDNTSEDQIEVFLGPSAVVKKEKSDDVFQKSYSELFGVSREYKRRFERRIKRGYKGVNGAHSKQLETEEIFGYSFLDCVIPPQNLEDLAKLYDVSPAHHAAVNAKVESVYGLGYEWKETRRTKAKNPTTDRGRKTKEKWVENAKYEMEEWLASLNQVDEFEEIIRKIGIDYETMGNAYLEIGRDRQGNIGYLGHVPASRIRVRRERDGFVFIFSNEVQFFRNFGAKDPNPLTDDPNPNELIHFKKPTPSNSYYGLPDIMSAQNALAGNEFASRYNLDYFENKSIPRHVIITKGVDLSQRSVNRLIEFFEVALKGQHHRSIYVPLGKSPDAEIKFESLESTKQDFSFSEYRNANNEEILLAHRVPASRAGLSRQGQTLAAARDADKVFKESYSRPEQAIFEKKIARVVKERTDALRLKLNELSLTDADTQSKIDERDVRMGIVVADEVRADRGRGPRPDGKGMQPFEAKAQQAADQRATANKSRSRDSERSAGATDSAGEGRNAKGEGRNSN